MVAAAEILHRKRRFAELLAKFDNNKAELGRALGWKSGAYVRQIIDGERPITEKVIEKVHAMQAGKFRGWFDQGRREDAPASASDTWPLAPFYTPETWAQLDPTLRHIGAHAAAKAVQDALQLLAASGKPRAREHSVIQFPTLGRQGTPTPPPKGGTEPRSQVVSLADRRGLDWGLF